MLDASFARKVTELSRYSGVHIKKLKIYIPRSWDDQLDDALDEVIKRASKGFSFVICKEVLQLNTSTELHKRGFTLESTDSYTTIQW